MRQKQRALRLHGCRVTVRLRANDFNRTTPLAGISSKMSLRRQRRWLGFSRAKKRRTKLGRNWSRFALRLSRRGRCFGLSPSKSGGIATRHILKRGDLDGFTGFRYGKGTSSFCRQVTKSSGLIPGSLSEQGTTRLRGFASNAWSNTARAIRLMRVRLLMRGVVQGSSLSRRRSSVFKT